MNGDEERIRLVHDRQNKLLGLSIALAIHQEEAYGQLWKQYQTICRKLRRLERIHPSGGEAGALVRTRCTARPYAPSFPCRPLLKSRQSELDRLRRIGRRIRGLCRREANLPRLQGAIQEAHQVGAWLLASGPRGDDCSGYGLVSSLLKDAQAVSRYWLHLREAEQPVFFRLCRRRALREVNRLLGHFTQPPARQAGHCPCCHESLQWRSASSNRQGMNGQSQGD